LAKRRKSSPLEDFLEVVALLPWWAGVLLAVAGYVILHRLAQPVPVSTLQPGAMATAAVRSVGASLAGYAQYGVPVLCLVGAGMSAWRRRIRRTLVSNVAQAKGADALDGMSWREFELLVGEAFRLQGFRVLESGGGGADGGVDLVLSRGGEKFLVQCKQWKAYKVGVEVVRELYGVMAARGATGGFVVTSGVFSGDARAFAQGRNVKLVDGVQLFALIRQARDSLAVRPTAQQPRPGNSQPASAPHGAMATPLCPTCATTMVKRTARKGQNAGGEFWGCVQFPACRGVRPIQ